MINLLTKRQETVTERLRVIFCPKILVIESNNFNNNFSLNQSIEANEEELATLQIDRPPNYSPPPSYSSITGKNFEIKLS